MTGEMLRTLYRYNAWANERVLDATARLTPEQLVAPAAAGQRSVRDTLTHMIDTQRGFLSWWDGSLSLMEAYSLKLDPESLPDLAAVRSEWEPLQRQTEAFVSGLTGADAARVCPAKLPNGIEWNPMLWQMMLHVANHGTQHRSEVASIIAAHGASPGDLDLLFYLMGR